MQIRQKKNEFQEEKSVLEFERFTRLHLLPFLEAR